MSFRGNPALVALPPRHCKILTPSWDNRLCRKQSATRLHIFDAADWKPGVITLLNAAQQYRPRPCALRHHELAVPQIGDQHVTRRVTDGQRRTGLHDCGLRSDTARPENRDLSGADGHRVAVVGRGQIGDAQRRGIPACTGVPCTDG